MRRVSALLLAALVLVAAACGDGEDTGSTASTAAPAATETQQQSGSTGCRAVPEPEPRQVDLDRPTTRLDPAKTYTVTLRTSCGDIGFELDGKRQPRTAASFAALVRDGFFDGLAFHRIVPGFVIQGGDPAGDGSGGPGYSVTEAPPANAQYTRGAVAMAKTALERPGTSGSQFFIVTGADAGLPADYALLGRVTSGMDTVERIASVPTDAGERPAAPVVIEKATLARS